MGGRGSPPPRLLTGTFLTYREKRGKEKREYVEEKGEVEKWKKEGLENEERTFFFFWNLFWVYQNRNFLPGKSISRWEKNQEKLLCPLWKKFLLRPWPLALEYFEAKSRTRSSTPRIIYLFHSIDKFRMFKILEKSSCYKWETHRGYHFLWNRESWISKRISAIFLQLQPLPPQLEIHEGHWAIACPFVVLALMPLKSLSIFRAFFTYRWSWCLFCYFVQWSQCP